jgi:hypothetical protein
MKMEPIESSETSASNTQTPGIYPKERKLYLEHGENLKSRNIYQFIRHIFYLLILISTTVRESTTAAKVLQLVFQFCFLSSDRENANGFSDHCDSY